MYQWSEIEYSVVIYINNVFMIQNKVNDSMKIINHNWMICIVYDSLFEWLLR